MKTTELRQKELLALRDELKALQRAYFGLRMQKATQQITNTAMLRTARRAIARAKTVLVEKQRVQKSAK